MSYDKNDLIQYRLELTMKCGLNSSNYTSSQEFLRRNTVFCIQT